MIKKIPLCWIVVKDLKKALDYYTRVVGMKLEVHDETFGWAELTGKEEGGARLGIAQQSDNEAIGPGQNSVITLEVEDLDKASKELKAKGAHLKGDPLVIEGHVKMQLFVDPDGNHLQLVEVLG